jgi:hypothetical protein
MGWEYMGSFLPVKKYFPVIFSQCGHELPFERMHARDRWRFVDFRKEELSSIPQFSIQFYPTPTNILDTALLYYFSAKEMIRVLTVAVCFDKCAR